MVHMGSDGLATVVESGRARRLGSEEIRVEPSWRRILVAWRSNCRCSIWLLPLPLPTPHSLTALGRLDQPTVPRSREQTRCPDPKRPLPSRTSRPRRPTGPAAADSAVSRHVSPATGGTLSFPCVRRPSGGETRPIGTLLDEVHESSKGLLRYCILTILSISASLTPRLPSRSARRGPGRRRSATPVESRTSSRRATPLRPARSANGRERTPLRRIVGPGLAAYSLTRTIHEPSALARS